MLVTVLAVVLLHLGEGNIFLHNPRGSNNKLNGKDRQDINRKRLFDSQNHIYGGYLKGDMFDIPAASRKDPKKQYTMKYYGSGKDASSKLIVEWTNQHGCGGNDKVDCNIVIQYMCMNNGTDANYPWSSSNSDGEIYKRNMYMRDGSISNSQNYARRSRGESDSSYASRMQSNYRRNIQLAGLQETIWWYDYCQYREANGALFTADQNLREGYNMGYVTASRTRQNPMGDQFGFECPEERDYYPYWMPTLQTENWDETSQRTPWIDAAWLGDEKMCGWMNSNSFNGKARYRCVLSGKRTYGRSINEDDCHKEGGNWVKFNSFLEVLTDITTEADCTEAAKSQGDNNIIWDKLRSDDESEVCIVQAPTMQCRQAPRTRANHLGNANYKDLDDSGTRANHLECIDPDDTDGAKYRGTLAKTISGRDCQKWTDQSPNEHWQNVNSNGLGDHNYCRNPDGEPSVWCYNAEGTSPRWELCAPPKCEDNADNYDNQNPDASRIELDLPYFPSGEAKRCVLRIRYNISTTDYDGWNTDSSFNNDDDVISNNPTIDVFGNGNVFDLNLNTAQTGRVFQDRSHIFEILPRTAAMEGKTIYNLNVKGKYGNIVDTFPATEYDFVPDRLSITTDDLVHIQWTGSNSARSGTDRNNLMQMNGDDLGGSYPHTIAEADFWDNVESLTDPDATGEDIAIGLASAGYYCSKKGTDICPADQSLDGKKRILHREMKNAPASYFGHVLKFKKACSMNYLCTRNNSFSNRSQKGSIRVRNSSKAEVKKRAEETKA